MNNVNERLNTMRRKKEEKARQANDTVKDGQLVMWPEQERRMPNELIRSALFTARAKTKKRLYFQDQPIYVYGKAEITYTGEELRAFDDEAVWLQICHLFRQVAVHKSEYVEFTTNEILAELGWDRSGSYYKKLADCIKRLDVGNVRVQTERLNEEFEFSFGMIRKAQRVGRGGRTLWRIYMEPECIKMFKGVFYTRVEWDSWKAFGSIARRLDGWIKSHKEPKPISMENIRKLLHSDNKSDASLRQKINGAMEEIKLKGSSIKDYWWESNKLCVERIQANEIQTSMRSIESLIDNEVNEIGKFAKAY